MSTAIGIVFFIAYFAVGVLILAANDYLKHRGDHGHPGLTCEQAQTIIDAYRENEMGTP